ncbi:hypothetical protein CR162_10800 [Pseudoroseomonas rhizosphaerae]|uniref:DUF4169 domain-containing protein n=1 Tax=Teichococcus rhizosphaerae TaxID=1335062 RepID=A0A2C7AA63_9PROT|nr:hypothetical protein [Pseudoroseomonas rhizosphaerae]PHK94919.1 hypothetical protein CR162_10800 [Pseudoroseomonas rhizosphaerae]
MARIPNYGQQRAERNRAKQAKADAKAQQREEERARRKAAIAAGQDPDIGEPVTLPPDGETEDEKAG